MSKTPNYKAEAHKAITRILSLDSQVQRERVLAEFLKDIHERGEVAAVHNRAKVVRVLLRPAPKKMPILAWPNRADTLAAETKDFLEGLGNLGKTLNDLTRDLVGVR